MNSEFAGRKCERGSWAKKGHKYTLRIFIWYFYDCFNRYQLKCARANALQTRATHLQGPFAWICALLQRMLLYTAHWPNHNKRWNFHIGISQIKIRTNKSTIKWMVLFFVFSSFLLIFVCNGVLASSICLWPYTHQAMFYDASNQFGQKINSWLVTKLRFEPIKSDVPISHFDRWIWNFILLNRANATCTEIRIEHIKLQIKFTFWIQNA